ncbi:hypothetical protein BG011_000992 [Mortierella polycephala]|uniref:DUF4187 domain-containing protein n=1 Tax=Mortierella polycephala TaxID=41804 RepID=A0A9P6PLS5_9FUNG|nr:hypothetical protein BG011_000992 [Mortierella polycephala]
MSNIQDSEEEEDYMSEAFLNSLVEANNKDSKKKAEITYSERRQQKEREHLDNLPKPLHVREKEAREKGLEKEIGEENKGMAMLLRMGFKKGGTLGAHKPNPDTLVTPSLQESSQGSINSENSSVGRSDALRAPIAIQMKQGRGGLGMDSSKKRQAEEELQRKEQESHRVFDKEFRGQKIDQFEQEKRKRQLGAARGICMRMDAQRASKDQDMKGDALDQKEGHTENHVRIGRSNSFWWIADSVPDEILGTKLMGPGAEVTIDDQVFDHSDQEDGDLVTKNKRTKLDPQLLKDHERLGLGDEEEDEEPAKWGERHDFAELEVSEKLEKVVKYLRSEHSYCFWCSAQYDGPEDLAENCPGETEDDH